MGNNTPSGQEKIEGLDKSEGAGWGDYPLDSVFVRKDTRTVSEIMTRIDKGRYVLDPDFQRDFVWSPQQQSRLIESCLMRIPLPVFYVAEAKDGKIIVVDGLQRLTTFHRYLKNRIALIGLGEGQDESSKSLLIGRKFKDLPLTLQERLEDTQLTLYILDAKAPERAKLDIFERVNGGVPLTRQQMRNCLFNGPATKWLKEASNTSLFTQVTGGSLDKKKMRDREAINRFCAFKLLKVKNYRGDMDDFLARSLDLMNGFSEDELDKLMNDFELSMENNFSLFGKHAFRKSLGAEDKYASRTIINIALFDVCSVIFSRIPLGVVNDNKGNIRNVLYVLLRNSSFVQSITYSTNSVSQVRSRFSLMLSAIKEVIE